jgi:hypothetical protein
MDNSFQLTELQLLRLDAEFLIARIEAEEFATQWNAVLPVQHCPNCGATDHCPGLACPDCSYVHPISWSILRDTEFGYEVVSLNNRRNRIAVFQVKQCP